MNDPKHPPSSGWLRKIPPHLGCKTMQEVLDKAKEIAAVAKTTSHEQKITARRKSSTPVTGAIKSEAATAPLAQPDPELIEKMGKGVWRQLALIAPSKGITEESPKPAARTAQSYLGWIERVQRPASTSTEIE